MSRQDYYKVDYIHANLPCLALPSPALPSPALPSLPASVQTCWLSRVNLKCAQQHRDRRDIGVIPFMLATVISLLPPLRAVPASPRPAASRHGASGMLTGLEPTSWQAWSLQDVGLFDGAAFVLAASAVYATSRQEDDSVANHEDSKLRDEAAARVREAERAVEQSVLASPCNGPNPELLAELEAADQAAQRLSRSAAPTSDPFELPSAFEMPTWRQPKSTQRRGQAPRMMAAPPEALGEIVIGDHNIVYYGKVNNDLSLDIFDSIGNIFTTMLKNIQTNYIKWEFNFTMSHNTDFIKYLSFVLYSFYL